jgi:spore coat polysaccharide biosynthesis protein SpsF (cytidylyltransferase family)
MERNSKVLLIIQARTSSSRLPGKMVKEFCKGKTLAEYVFSRCSLSGFKTVIATSSETSDDRLAEICGEAGFGIFRGSLDNVLERYVECARNLNADVVIRVCGDSPFVDSLSMSEMVALLSEKGLDYLSYKSDTIPAGLEFEVVTLKALEASLENADEDADREHVTRYVLRNPGMFISELVDGNSGSETAGRLKLTVDTEDDFRRCAFIAGELEKLEKEIFDNDDIYEIFERNQSVLEIEPKLAASKLR